MDDYVQESERVGNGRETCVAIVDNYRKSRKNKMSEGMTDNNKKCQRENLMALFGVIPDPQDKPHLFCDVCGIKCKSGQDDPCGNPDFSSFYFNVKEKSFGMKYRDVTPEVHDILRDELISLQMENL